ncbi:hypothetical protein FX983_06547 [Pseudomonas frederiksbergensis]|uniref:Uncharacterized protein n=1 Tax=Pseudomonas frederiksbergensis TaxID=104087 RepID=A0A6L5BMZ8_9PSED|nr:hypothetical protein FX983_06547 [Pseudomonas frederiksbergensis]
MQVRIAFLRREVVIQNPLLQRRQCIDVLHIGYATGSRRDYAVDFILSQRGQRQHVRGDVCAAIRDRIGRHHDFNAAADRCGECREGRLTEQDAYVRRQINLTHAFDQFHRQQRVPAQFKEMIVATNLLQLQQLLPNFRDGNFHFALRSFISAAHHRGLIRHRQRLTVQLAVGCQRE